MLTRLKINNFKRIASADIELGSAVVFVGPNNSGKTTALQALALWHTGLKTWVAERGEKSKAKERTGVTINRRGQIALPVPNAALLWRDLHVREVERVNGKPKTSNVYITIEVQGQRRASAWTIGLEFYYANPESFYCRPVGELSEESLEILRWAARNTKVVFLPPMSGLASSEPRVDPGRINVLLGEGQTAQVLRNLCFSLYESSTLMPAEHQRSRYWGELVESVRKLFGVEILPPNYDAVRGEVNVSYRSSRNGVELDISAAGRGMQQTLLLLAFLYANPGATIMLDEPDAHLEVLRQRETFNLIKRVAERSGGQILAASHSEVVLNEAAGKDTVIAFVGEPHRINDQGSQLRKALLSIGFEHYLQAEQNGWVLYLEGSTDLAILQTLARRLGHDAAMQALERPYVDYVNSNTPPTARDRYFGLREAQPTLLGLAIFDRLERPMALQTDEAGLTEVIWRKREIESYIVTRSALLAWATAGEPDDLIGRLEGARRHEAMETCIAELEQAFRVRNQPSPWSGEIKASDEFLDPLFANFAARLGQPGEQMRKKDYYELAETIPLDQIDPEVREKLDLIVAVAARARPRTE